MVQNSCFQKSEPPRHRRHDRWKQTVSPTSSQLQSLGYRPQGLLLGRLAQNRRIHCHPPPTTRVCYIQTAKEATLRFRTRNNILKLSDDDVSIESYLNPNPSPEQQDNSQDQETLKQQVHQAGQSDDEDEDMWEAVTSPPRTTRTSADNLPDPGPPLEEEEMEDHQETLAAANDLLVPHTTVSHRPRMEDLEAQGSSPTDEPATLFTKEWNQWYSRVGS